MTKDMCTVTFNVDPYRGFAMQAVAAVPDNYKFVKMKRKGEINR